MRTHAPPEARDGGAVAARVELQTAHPGRRPLVRYSVFGSKDGLVDALAQTAFEFLGTGIEELPETDDPAADLVEVGVSFFRRLVREHPALYRIAFQIARLEEGGLLPDTSPEDATVAFEAVMEGMANAELRGATLRILPEGEEERAWREALVIVIRGLGASADTTRPNLATTGSTEVR